MKKLVGAILKRERKRKKKTQQQVADSLGTDKQYVSSVENGRKNITINRLKEISNAIGSEDDDILNKKTNEPLNPT